MEWLNNPGGYNIFVSFPTVVILMLCCAYYLSVPFLSTNRNRYFLALLTVTSLTIVFDIWSSILDNINRLTPNTVSYGYCFTMNFLFFLFFNARIYFFFLYVKSCLPKLGKKTNIFITIAHVTFFIIFEAFVIACLFHKDVIFFIDKDGLFVKARLYRIIYSTYFFFISFMGFMICGAFFQKKLKKSEFINLMVDFLILLSGILIRYFFPRILIMDLFSLLAAILLYLQYQEHSIYFDRVYHTFNDHAFQVYLEEWLPRKGDVYLLGVGVMNYNRIRQVYGIDLVKERLQIMAEDLKHKYSKCKIFYLQEGNFLIYSDKPLDFAQEIQKMKDSELEFAENTVILPAGHVSFHLNKDKMTDKEAVRLLYHAFDIIDNPNTDKDIVIDDSLYQEMNMEDYASNAIDDAIKNNGIEAYIQLIYDRKTNALTAGEVLARIKDSDGKLVMPGLFIPIAERNGKILEIGEEIFSQACDFLKKDESRLLTHINVNLSPLQCITDAPTNRLMNIAEEKNIQKERLILEITEESMVDDKILSCRMKKIASQGYKFALDDFGSGYSNIAKLNKYPFNIVKLDIGIIRQHFKDPDNSLIPYIVKDLKHVGFEIVAEGVETKEMADSLLEMGVDYLQGYYYAKPIPLSEYKPEMSEKKF